MTKKIELAKEYMYEKFVEEMTIGWAFAFGSAITLLISMIIFL